MERKDRPMARIALRIPQIYRYILYSVLSLCWLSGLGFWLIRRYGQVEGDFGLESHPFQYPLLQTHGLAAFLMLMSLGAIFTAHVPMALRSGRELKWGMSLLVMVCFSAISAYTLYYLVTEDWHEWLGNVHAVVGFCLPLMLWLHIRIGRQRKVVAPRTFVMEQSGCEKA